VPTKNCWLEYEKALPPRIPLACPLTFKRSFSMGRNEALACGDWCSGVSRSSATLNRPSRPKSDLPPEEQRQHPWKSPGQVGRAGLHWTVEVAPERETPSHPAATGGKLSPPRPIENAAAKVTGQANGFRSGEACPYSSQSTFVGAFIVTDKNILPPNSELSPVL
jgi:hypothetical protein